MMSGTLIFPIKSLATKDGIFTSKWLPKCCEQSDHENLIFSNMM